jgi:hypothetical protein
MEHHYSMTPPPPASYLNTHYGDTLTAAAKRGLNLLHSKRSSLNTFGKQTLALAEVFAAHLGFEAEDFLVLEHSLKAHIKGALERGDVTGAQALRPTLTKIQRLVYGPNNTPRE